jgi:hypothetical protein
VTTRLPYVVNDYNPSVVNDYQLTCGMAKATSNKKATNPSSVRLPEDLRVKIMDWCWLNHKSFNEFMVSLVEDFIEKHPLTKEQRNFIEKHREKKSL